MRYIKCISSFILPPQSLYRSIFSSNSDSHILYAILWLARPLVKNIPDSPFQYLANAIFGTSLADEGGVHVGKNQFMKFGPQGGNISVTQFHTQFTHIFRYFEALNSKQKCRFMKNYFDNVVSDLWKKAWFFLENTLKKVPKEKTKKNLKSFKASVFSKSYYRQIEPFFSKI